ncbi:MAG: bifunctional tetrahydrofolate synthase/dihydrofolate synthase [Burkholderiaceae bacterium]|nr:bifunctional tetrahydrofolate synthase/dihydrofolate synthase [Burkholderiaceae bacterium]MEB2318516.1 bifunctional tetrahydrofolate synthase/dihydrofolate synthase [Pseudomonadota bacterium]
MSDPAAAAPGYGGPALAAWLDRLERLHPRAIELGLERAGAVAARLGLRFDCKVFVVAGTNGKGSTCAMLEAILLAAGYRVGLYTSPHLVHFNERVRIDGVALEDARIVAALEEVDAARGDVSLTYFEFTTLALARILSQAGLDAVILEVGLGGRLDAVNLFDADCAIVTSIDIDHAQWLGESREAIGLEKAHVFRAGRPAICSDPQPPASLVAHAEAIGADLWLFGRDFNYAGDRQQWSWGGRAHRRNSLAYPALRGANQLLNAAGVLAALDALRDALPVPQHAVRRGLAQVELAGRFQVLPGRPSIVLDVAHNPHAAAHLATNLEQMGFFPATWAVFGAMGDKDLDGIIAAMAPVVNHWITVSLPGERAAQGADLAARLRANGIGGEGDRHSVTVAATPVDGLETALGAVHDADRIVVFGSFLTVADVLGRWRRSRG